MTNSKNNEVSQAHKDGTLQSTAPSQQAMQTRRGVSTQSIEQTEPTLQTD